MSTLQKDKATIGIVNYKTLDLTRLCLRTIRKFTRYPYEVIVVDNDSRDASLEYLKSLPWIRLIQRPPQADNPSGSYAHAAALDLAVENCRTEFFVSLHSDAFPRKDNWLGELIGHFRGDPRIACVGSGKLENIALWRQWLKQASDIRTFWRRLRREPDLLGFHRYYNRTICCLYRTAVLQREHLSFVMDNARGLTAGQKLYFELVDRGYKTVELSPAVMSRYVVHLAHATQVVNNDEFNMRRRTIRKCRRLIGDVLADPAFRDVLNDASLDR
jgi:glycosyltransferase involved in cell wall biosynthesis